MRFANVILTTWLLTFIIGIVRAAPLNGDATFYEPGLGACGQTNNANQFVVALSSSKYGNGGHCGKNISVHYKGKSVTAEAVDKCPGCSANSIDLSLAAFHKLADESLGRIPVTWEFV